MGRFKAITQEPSKRKTITLPFPGASYDVEAGKWTGPVDLVDIAPLRPDQDDDVVRLAKEFAKSKGVTNPEPGDELYERGRIIHTLAITCIDKDSPVDAPVPYFESWEEIHKSTVLLPETLQYLYQHQRTWQDEVSPLRQDLKPDEFIEGMKRTIDGDADFFLSLRPGMQWSCFASMASQLADSMKRVSQLSSQLEPQTPNES